MWTIDGVRVFIQEVKPKRSVISAELNPLGDTESIIHYFGSKSRRYTIAGLFVGFDTEEKLNQITASGNVVLLSGNKGFIRNILIQDFQYNWEHTIAQTFDPDHNCDDPVFKFTMEAVEQ